MTDFKTKMHQILFRLRLCPRPRWGSLQRSPDPLAGFGGHFAAGRWAGLGKSRGRGWRGSGGEGKGGPSSYCWTRAPRNLATPLQFIHLHCSISYEWLPAADWRVAVWRASVSRTIGHPNYYPKHWLLRCYTVIQSQTLQCDKLTQR